MNENVLNAVDPLLFPTFSNSDECSYEENPTVLNKLAFQARGTNYIDTEVNGKLECVLSRSPSITYIPPSYIKTCYALKAYCTWNYLLGVMNNARNNNSLIPNIMPNSESIYLIRFPFLVDGTKVFDNFSP